MIDTILPATHSLEEFPDEILSYICEELWFVSIRPAFREVTGALDSDEEDSTVHDQVRETRRAARRGLHSLTLTSKRCNTAAVRLLYRAIDLCTTDPGRPVHKQKFLQSILSNANLARMVRQLYFECFFEVPGECTQDLEKVIVSELLGGGIRAEQNWGTMDDVAKGLILLEGLLRRMRSLQHLGFDPGSNNESTTQATLLPGVDLRTLLPDLRSLEYRNDWTAVDPDTTLAYDLLCRTRVESLALSNLIDLENLTTRGSGTVSKQIKVLTLRNCLFSAESLDRLLKSCPNLENFTYQVGLQELFDSDTLVDERATAADIVRSLRKYNKKLKHLQLDVNGHWQFDGHRQIPGYIAEDETLPALSGFPLLTHIYVNRFDLTPVLKGDYKELKLEGNDKLNEILSSGDIPDVLSEVIEDLKEVPAHSSHQPNRAISWINYLVASYCSACQ